MIRLQDVVTFLREFAPPELAEDWDNVGLLIGDPADEIRSVLTCLTLTPNVAEEAISRGVQLVVTHHPVLFHPVQRLTTETTEETMTTDEAVNEKQGRRSHRSTGRLDQAVTLV